jgi:NAD(P)-dependent dehydrogenase (short-subunit alcohol dehydrogenase family)
MNRPLDGRRVAVIGGSSGIGYEVARQAREQGATVVVTGRDRAKLAAAARRLGGAAALLVDAHDGEALPGFFEALGGVDHLVSMVGDTMSGGFLATPTGTMSRVLHSKFMTNWAIGRHAAGVVRPGGSVTFTAGTGGRPQDISASYVANQGIAALVTGLAAELAPGIRVNAVAPTFMDTPLWRDVPAAELESIKATVAARVPLGRLGTVGEVASTYLHLMSNGFITGQTVAVDGGIMLVS